MIQIVDWFWKERKIWRQTACRLCKGIFFYFFFYFGFFQFLSPFLSDKQTNDTAKGKQRHQTEHTIYLMNVLLLNKYKNNNTTKRNHQIFVVFFNFSLSLYSYSFLHNHFHLDLFSIFDCKKKKLKRVNEKRIKRNHQQPSKIYIKDQQLKPIAREVQKRITSRKIVIFHRWNHSRRFNLSVQLIIFYGRPFILVACVRDRMWMHLFILKSILMHLSWNCIVNVFVLGLLRLTSHHHFFFSLCMWLRIMLSYVGCAC